MIKLKQLLNEVDKGFLYLDIDTNPGFSKKFNFFIGGVVGKSNANKYKNIIEKLGADKVEIRKTSISTGDEEYVEGETHVVDFTFPMNDGKKQIKTTKGIFKVNKNMKEFVKLLESSLGGTIKTGKYW